MQVDEKLRMQKFVNVYQRYREMNDAFQIKQIKHLYHHQTMTSRERDNNGSVEH